MTAEAVDLDGFPRVVMSGRTLAKDSSALPDIGCYECQLNPTFQEKRENSGIA